MMFVQLFVGRVAMLGFAAELIGEELTGEHDLHSFGVQYERPDFQSLSL